MLLSFQTSAAPDSRDLLGIERKRLVAELTERGLKPIHAEATWADVHRRLHTSIVDVRSPLPRVQALLQQGGFEVRAPEVAAEMVSTDGFTRRFLLRFHDGVSVETVLMRYEGRATACVSTQAGCAMGCVFCATGQAGFRRHLAAGEIVAQAYHVARLLRAEGKRLRNIVFMGQGEPLHNYDPVMSAIRMLTDQHGLAVASRRISVSTVGLVPEIRRMADDGCPASLAVSLHGATDRSRNALVPIARRWPLNQLMDACRYYSDQTENHIFFEWTLIDEENDSETDALDLAQLLADQKAHVNLIPLNPTAGYAGAPTSNARARRFQNVLRGHDIPSTIRQRRGLDIAAGCGQLAARGS